MVLIVVWKLVTWLCGVGGVTIWYRMCGLLHWLVNV